MNATPTVNTTCTEWQPAPAAAPRAFCAIGDIHGCANLLAALRAHLDTAAPGVERVYLGDLIDPHPKRAHDHDCASVLNQVADDLDRGASALAGNHDAFLLIAMCAIADETKFPWHSEPTLWRVKAARIRRPRGVSSARRTKTIAKSRVRSRHV